MRNQRASLKKQRDDYMQRAGALKRELKILKQQRADLSSGREPPSPTTNSFIKENDKLQVSEPGLRFVTLFERQKKRRLARKPQTPQKKELTISACPPKISNFLLFSLSNATLFLAAFDCAMPYILKRKISLLAESRD